MSKTSCQTNDTVTVKFIYLWQCLLYTTEWTLTWWCTHIHHTFTSKSFPSFNIFLILAFDTCFYLFRFSIYRTSTSSTRQKSPRNPRKTSIFRAETGISPSKCYLNLVIFSLVSIEMYWNTWIHKDSPLHVWVRTICIGFRSYCDSLSLIAIIIMWGIDA